MSKWWFVLLVLPSVVWAACPNKCSGHGSCGLNDVCQCMQDWVGGDCSGRQCPFTRAWHDTAQRDNDAHYYAECGNRGTCDRTTGECACDAGFVGSGCRRMQCPNDCSGHGTCEFIEELASNNFNKRIQGVAGRVYGLWDQEKIMGCVCDANYEGHDCSLRTCPKGDDPLTPIGADMQQAIVISPSTATTTIAQSVVPTATAPATVNLGATTNTFYLTYYDPYGNAYTTERILIGASAADTCANVQVALRRLPNNVLNTVTVSSTARFYKFVRPDLKDLNDIYTTGTGKVYKVLNTAANSAVDATTNPENKIICLVTFASGPGTTGYQNMLDCNTAAHNGAGQHPITMGVFDSATPAVQAACNVYEWYPTAVGWPPSGTMQAAPCAADPDNQICEGTTAYRPLTELAECSGRGTCDYTTGTCTCFAGHMGLACQSQEALV